MRDVVVLCAGIHPYGKFPNKHYTGMAMEACQRAVADSGADWKDIGAMYCGSVISVFHEARSLVQIQSHTQIHRGDPFFSDRNYASVGQSIFLLGPKMLLPEFRN